jgi:hypothetical protein
MRILRTNINTALQAGTFADTTPRTYGLRQTHPDGIVMIVSGIQVFKPIISMLNE